MRKVVWIYRVMCLESKVNNIESAIPKSKKKANPFGLAFSNRLVELAGVEPASKISLTYGATCLVYLYSRQCAANRHATKRHTRILFRGSAL